MQAKDLHEGMIALNSDGVMVLITEIAYRQVCFMNLDTHEMGAYEVVNFEVPLEPFTSDGANAIVNYNETIIKVWKKYLGLK